MLFKGTSIKRRDFFLWVLISIPYVMLIPATFWYYHKVNDINNSCFVVINKGDMTLSLYNYKGELIQQSNVATGKNSGAKVTYGDLKTPEGVFNVTSIEDASNWTHDFKDDTLGTIKGAYGPYFIRLNVPGQKGIGIHGTHDENSIGSRASEGCIRMKNHDLVELVSKIKISSVVIIIPGVEDIKENKRQNDSAIRNLSKVNFKN